MSLLSASSKVQDTEAAFNKRVRRDEGKTERRMEGKKQERRNGVRECNVWRIVRSSM